MWTRDEMAEIAASELTDGQYVNLGIGIPTLVANNIPEGMTVTLQSENGMLGIGPFPYEDQVDPDLINAGKQTISELPSSSYFDSAASWGRSDLSAAFIFWSSVVVLIYGLAYAVGTWRAWPSLSNKEFA